MIIKDISSNWKEQGSRPGNPPMRKETAIDLLVLHHTADVDTEKKDVDSIIYYHTHPNHVCNGKYGCWTICYHYYIENIEGETVLWKTVPHTVVTFHAGKWNRRSLGIVYDGKNDYDKKYPAIIETLGNLCLSLDLNPYIAIQGHRNLYWSGWEMKNGVFRQKTSCPGDQVDMTKIREDVAAYINKEGYFAHKVDIECMVYNGENYITEERYNELTAKYNHLTPEKKKPNKNGKTKQA